MPVLVEEGVQEVSSGYQVKLDVFEGPMDLLLHLIEREKIDIHDIPIAKILEHYMDYIKIFEILDMNVSGDFAVMASTLMWIKSKMLLPPDPTEEEGDPREDLVQRLLEYQKLKSSCGFLEDQEGTFLQRYERGLELSDLYQEEVVYDVQLFDLVKAFSQVLKRKDQTDVMHEIAEEPVTVADKINEWRTILQQRRRCSFQETLSKETTRLGLICLFLSLLELIRLKEVRATQKDSFADIQIERIDSNEGRV